MRKAWQAIPVFLPGKSHGQRSLVGCSPWGRQRVRHDGSVRNAGLDEVQAGIKIAGRNISNLRYADDTTLWHKVKRN